MILNSNLNITFKLLLLLPRLHPFICVFILTNQCSYFHCRPPAAGILIMVGYYKSSSNKPKPELNGQLPVVLDLGLGHGLGLIETVHQRHRHRHLTHQASNKSTYNAISSQFLSLFT